jgi:hypothetical protein
VDALSGGGGSDKFIFATGGSSVSLGASSLAGNGAAHGIDQIRDWTSSDKISFSLGTANAGSALNFSTATGTDFNDAVSEANAHLGTGGKYVAVQVGGDVIVFADTSNDSHITTADDAVTLVGKTLADITASNIVG